MNNNLRTVLTIGVFALLFVSVGWIAPAIYATYAPADHYIEANEFRASDVSTGQDTHHICFDRTINKPTTGTVITELYLVPAGDETPQELLSKDDDRYFQQGQYIVNIDVEMPPDIEKGEYRYMRVYRMELANGRVQRSFVFESNSFNVTDEPIDPTTNTSC